MHLTRGWSKNPTHPKYLPEDYIAVQQSWLTQPVT